MMKDILSNNKILESLVFFLKMKNLEAISVQLIMIKIIF